MSREALRIVFLVAARGSLDRTGPRGNQYLLNGSDRDGRLMRRVGWVAPMSSLAGHSSGFSTHAPEMDPHVTEETWNEAQAAGLRARQEAGSGSRGEWREREL